MDADYSATTTAAAQLQSKTNSRSVNKAKKSRHTLGKHKTRYLLAACADASLALSLSLSLPVRIPAVQLAQLKCGQSGVYLLLRLAWSWTVECQ